MRQITEQATRAFEQGKNFKQANTQVICDSTGKYLYLWGNLIAQQLSGRNNSLQVRLCGYNTVTTRERLNGLWGVNISCRKGNAYLNGKPMDNYAWYNIGLRLGA